MREFSEETLTNSVLIIDGIGTFMGLTKALDAYSDTEVRKVLSPLGKVAERFNMVIIMIGHLNKNTNAELIRAVMASVAFPDVCRVTYVIIIDEENEERHYFMPIKWNLKELKNTGIEFTIEKETDRIDLTREMSAEQVRFLSMEHEPGERRSLTQANETDRFLEEELKHEAQQPKDMVKKAEVRAICGRDFLYKRVREMKKKGLMGTFPINGKECWSWRSGSGTTTKDEEAPE